MGVFMHEEFLKLYNRVFNDDSITNCGRESCIKLINLGYQITDKYSLGDVNTGFINISNMKKLYKEVIENEI